MEFPLVRSSLADIYTAMYDRGIIVLFTFIIFSMAGVFQQRTLIYVISCKPFIVVDLHPVDCSEYHSEYARLIRSIPKVSSSFLDSSMSAVTLWLRLFFLPLWAAVTARFPMIFRSLPVYLSFIKFYAFVNRGFST